MNPEIPDVDPEVTNNAVSVYGQNDDAMEDFPVLRAFQQYVDAEQAKSRKRLLSMGIFFGVLMVIVIAVFMVLLVTVSERNQALNDKMLEFVMKEHDRDRGLVHQPAAPVVVQPPSDNSAILALTTKLDEMQKKLSDSQAAAEKAQREKKAAEDAAVEAAKPKTPSASELEVLRLKKMLADQKAKSDAEAEKKRKHEEEIEAYRRQHYPELYAPKKKIRKIRKRVVEPEDDFEDDDEELDEDDLEGEEIPARKSPSRKAKRKTTKRQQNQGDAMESLLNELNDQKAVNYFDEEKEEKDDKKTAVKPTVAEPKPAAKPTPSLKKPAASKADATDDWQIPEE